MKELNLDFSVSWIQKIAEVRKLLGFGIVTSLLSFSWLVIQAFLKIWPDLNPAGMTYDSIFYSGEVKADL